MIQAASWACLQPAQGHLQTDRQAGPTVPSCLSFVPVIPVHVPSYSYILPPVLVLPVPFLPLQRSAAVPPSASRNAGKDPRISGASLQITPSFPFPEFPQPVLASNALSLLRLHMYMGERTERSDLKPRRRIIPYITLSRIS